MTPLDPHEFLNGVWKGEGALHPLWFIRWLFPEEDIRFESRATWLSETAWAVKEEFVFSGGEMIQRTMYAEMTDQRHVRITADDMPGGAEILLHSRGFRFTPYYIVARYKGFRWKLRCLDENAIDCYGVIHDRLKMSLFGIPVCTMFLNVYRS